MQLRLDHTDLFFSDIKHSISRQNFWVDLLFRLPRIYLNSYLIARGIKNVNKEIYRTQISIQGTTYKLEKNYSKFKEQGVDYSNEINQLNNVIKSYIKIKASYERMYLKARYRHMQLALRQGNEIVEETINALYDLQRLTKRITPKKNIPTSELAKSAAKHSANTLKKVYAR